jgi:hypothetical protein
MKKQRIVALAFAAVLLAPFAGVAQDWEGNAEGSRDRWNRSFLEPGFGAVLLHASVHTKGLPGIASAIRDEDMWLTAVDLRVFRGVALSKGGPFYTGLEAGTFIFLPIAKTLDDSVTVADPDYIPIPPWVSGAYSFEVAPYGGIVFLMAKYGVRKDVQKSKSKLGGGLELGVGGTLYSGGFDVSSEELYDTETKTGSSDAKVGPVFEAAAEGTIRIREAVRLSLKGSFLYMPLPPSEKQGPYDVVTDPDTNARTDQEYAWYALENYAVEFDPYVFGLRFGIILEFD